MERLLGRISWTGVQFPPPPNLDANREDHFDKESYFYVKGKLVRVEDPATINAVALK